MQNTNLPHQNFSNIREFSGPPIRNSSQQNQAFQNQNQNYVANFNDGFIPSQQTSGAPAQDHVSDDALNGAGAMKSTNQQAQVKEQPPAQTQEPTAQSPELLSQQAESTVQPQEQAPVDQSNAQTTNELNNVNDTSNTPTTNYKPSGEPVPDIKVNSDAINSIEDLLSLAVEKGASDLHVSTGYPPILRINGDLINIPAPILTDVQVVKLFSEILQDRQKQQLQNYLDIDFSYTHKTGNRFRINIFYKQGKLAGAFRLIPSQIRSIAELGIPSIVQDFTNVANGLVLLTGPTGSGKSTTIASIIQEINLTQPRHIITIEDPIEYVFPRAKALVNQREIGRDVRSWTRGLREILREDPDVVLVGEMRDYETISLTITAAETGHLVFSTLHTNSASQTIDRIIDVFPDVQQAQIRAQLANVIHAVVSQRLVPVKSGGRRAVTEVMIATAAIRNAIREKKTYQIDNMIQTGSEIGMASLEKSLVELIRKGEISLEEAQTYTVKHNDLISLLKQN